MHRFIENYTPTLQLIVPNNMAEREELHPYNIIANNVSRATHGRVVITPSNLRIKLDMFPRWFEYPWHYDGENTSVIITSPTLVLQMGMGMTIQMS